MDGYEVARQMRQLPQLKNVTIVALTGWGQEKDRAKTAAAGFNHHLVKPLESGALEEVLRGLPEEVT
jgi:CheY-like chemotaxis protein